MINPSIFDEISQKITNSLPDSARTIEQDMKKNIKTVLSSTFSKLDLVSRDEFDIQQQVLARTRKKVEELEAQLKTFEDNLKSS